jgi:hypothetical protein
VIDLAFFELTSKLMRIVAMLSTIRVQNSDFFAVGCGLNDCSSLPTDLVVLVLSETVLVLVLDGCLRCGDADRGSRRFSESCGPMGRIAILDLVEFEYRSPRRAEYESEKKYGQCFAPKSPPVLSWFFESQFPATSVSTGVRRDRSL